MVRVSDAVLEEIKDKTDIVSLVGEYVSLKRKGSSYWGCCPFHTEKTPSFSVVPEKAMFYCFGCHKGGSIFNFIMEIEGLGFLEAVRMAAEKAGVPIPVSQQVSDEEVLKRDALKDLYKRVAGSFHYILINSPQGAAARAYLTKRGIEQDTILNFQLGYAPGDPKWLYRFLRDRNFSPDFLAASGLFSKKYPEWPLFTNRLMFPVYNTRGEVVAFSGRTMISGNPQVPKYINSPETPLYHKSRLLYGIWQSRETLRKTGEFYLCEGNVDVLALHQAGFTSAVAPLGTAFTPEQAKLLKRYASGGMLLFDSDKAGKAATMKAGILFESQGIPVRAVKIPEKSDPAEILEKEGAESLKKLLQSPLNLFDFLLYISLVSQDISRPEGKEQIARDLFPYINSIESEIKKDLCLGILSEKLGVNQGALKRDMMRFRYGSQNRALSVQAKQASSSRTGVKVSDELFALMVVVRHGELFNALKVFHNEFDFQDRRAESLYRVLEECRAQEEYSLESLLQKMDDSELKQILVEKLSGSELDENPGELLNKTLGLVKRRQLQNRSKEISRMMDRISMEKGSWELLNELIAEKQVLDQEIEKLKVSQ